LGSKRRGFHYCLLLKYAMDIGYIMLQFALLELVESYINFGTSMLRFQNCCCSGCPKACCTYLTPLIVVSTLMWVWPKGLNFDETFGQYQKHGEQTLLVWFEYPNRSILPPVIKLVTCCRIQQNSPKGVSFW
jgi:hypothetical protein